MKIMANSRIGAIDAFRAITMFMMLFVNDMAGVADLPHWLKHADMYEDLMGFSDLVFPAFLFCIGLSVPYAIEARYRKGDDALSVIGHVVERTIALVIMGLFTLRCGSVDGGMSKSCFNLLMILSFFLMWNVYPRVSDWRTTLFKVLKWAGMALVLFLIVDRDLHGNSLRVGWWGILGLIGWSYAVSAGAYIFCRGKLKPLIVALAAVMVLSVITHSPIIPEEWGLRFFTLPFVPSDWTLHALSLSGVVTSVVMIHLSQKEMDSKKIIGGFLTAGVAMLILGFIAHPHWIISKIQATPTWYLFSMALFLPMFGILYWLTDIRGKRNAFRLIRAAGTSTLTCYMIPYVWYALVQAFHIHYPALLCSGIPGLLRSLVFALVVVLIVEGLGKLNIKLKI